VTAAREVYRCLVCGNVVEVVHPGEGALACCENPMELLAENSADASREKHVPIIEEERGRTKVTVGSAPHPMEQAHYIEWIELFSGERLCRAYLRPGDAPQAEFALEPRSAIARAYCNLHGLWVSPAGSSGKGGS